MRVDVDSQLHVAVPVRREPQLDRNVVEALYEMMVDEITQPQYDEREIALFKDPIYYYGRYLDRKTRRYAVQNLVSSISTAIAYLNVGETSCTRLVDLGCGLGMQSIIFASLGAEVLGIDLDSKCVELSRKRKMYFEARLGKVLNMDFMALDFRTFNPDVISRKYDALFSMSAFAHIQPLKATVANISALLHDTARVFLWDQNPDCLFSRVLGKRQGGVPRPTDITIEFAKHGFSTELLQGACAIPHHFWHPDAVFGATSWLNGILKKNLQLSFSYLFGASRKERRGP
jgi:2-polyprenyl-3-methyl-5-hydroxy-6-metoxy-1,4-benzoquinol methylase